MKKSSVYFVNHCKCTLSPLNQMAIIFIKAKAIGTKILTLRTSI